MKACSKRLFKNNLSSALSANWNGTFIRERLLSPRHCGRNRCYQLPHIAVRFLLIDFIHFSYTAVRFQPFKTRPDRYQANVGGVLNMEPFR